MTAEATPAPVATAEFGDAALLDVVLQELDEEAGEPARPAAQTAYDKLVEDLIAAMEKGELVWRQPWFCQQPTNLLTRRRYRGINILVLTWIAKKSGFTSRYWVTAKQAAKLGGAIKPEQLLHAGSILCVRWHRYKTRDGSGRHIFIPRLMVRAHEVFNLEQTTGLERRVPPEPRLDFKPVEAAENIVKGYEGRPRIEEDSDCACYMPWFDAVGMPPKVAFLSVEEYYATLFHELIHSTGHPSRLKRFQPVLFGWEDRADYAREELVAELGAAFLNAHAGLVATTAKNSAAYLQHWLAALRSDRKFLFWAAANAQKASDWILGVRPKPKPDENRAADEPRPGDVLA